MESLITKDQKSKTPIATLLLVTVTVGIGSGFFGMCLALLLHYIQHSAYGYSPLHIISNESFLQGVRSSSSERRILILTLCGLIAGCGWALLYHYGKPLVSIAGALKSEKKMPIGTTILHALLQIVTIALGSPLGREVAPREISAVFASWLSQKAGLNPQEIKIMLACGAGAGLAAVYNVPLGGAVFVLEVLLCSFNWAVVIPAITTSAIAVVVSWWGLGNEAMYQVPHLLINTSVVIWAILCGPIFGYAAFWFSKIAAAQRKKALIDWRMVIACLVNFTFIGLLAVYFPSLLGNGKSPAQLEFSASISISISALLLFLRCIITWSSLRVGAQGGLLTPSLANGALLGVVLGGFWNVFLPPGSSQAFAIIGASAFLAASQKMPLTAIILIFELTRIDLIFLIPMMLAIAGSVMMFRYASSATSHSN